MPVLWGQLVNNTEGSNGGEEQWARKQTKTKTKERKFPIIGSHNIPALKGLFSAQQNQ